jgi:hypothetical protein
MMRRLLLILPLVLAACASAPETRLTDAQIATLVRGKTTLTEVTSSFGPPSKTEKVEGGTRLIYGWLLSQKTDANLAARGSMGGGTAESQRREYLLTFTPGNVLQEIEARTLTTRSGNISAMTPP